MAALDDPELLLPDAQAWRQWLGDNHADASGVWLVLHKKGGAVTELTYEDALQEALCFGWIDGQVARRDAGSYRQRFTPRRSKSPWSASNVDRIGVLLEQGRMTPAGQRAVDAAKADGRWQRAYAGAATAQVPPDLAAAIAAVPEAASMFATLDAANRYALIYRVNEAKRDDTRARRIEKFVAMLARGETIHPQRAQR
ncbi:MAG: hypothetical protein QOK10_2928 [Pseudonocardiales bacterium]|jgi:uncharacterized protein YdeI (YjbR/CyaY-like superfamily)|nr:hypothetical protein [Pseudonocardiales bacterium]